MKNGADIISLAVPRIFSLPEDSLMEYLSDFLAAIPETPVLIQDFNPGGASISPTFIQKLKEKHPNFKYLKLEEPLCAPKFEEIIKISKGEIGLFEGWGGLYMLELIPIGIARRNAGSRRCRYSSKSFSTQKRRQTRRGIYHI